MGKCVVLAGGMASGKTTLAKALEQRGFRRIVTYTTRTIRDGEQDGIDYNFISENKFQYLYDTGFFAEVMVYNAKFGYCRYGSAKEDYNATDDTVIVLNPRGVINLSAPAFVVYLDYDNDILVGRAADRGDSIAEIARRIYDDKVYFEEMLAMVQPDLHITEPKPVEELVEMIVGAVRGSQNLRTV
jgi:guanylate kinase